MEMVIMSNIFHLKEVCIGNGSYGISASAVDYSPSLPTYLRITDIKDDGTLDFSGLKSVDDEKSGKYQLKPNDIVFARTGASTGKNYYYDKRDGEFVYAGFLIKFSLDARKVNPMFIKYYCQTNEYFGWVQNFDTGGTRGNLNAQDLGNMPIPVVPRDQQDFLVEILSSIDDKVRLLTRQNATLEELAQTYFRQWFVKDDCKLGRLDSVAKITMGQSPNGASYNENAVGTVFFQGRGEFGWRYPTTRLYTIEPSRMAVQGDILISVRAPVGDLNIAASNCCIGRGLAAIHSDYRTFILYALKEQAEQFQVFNGEGTVFGSITKDGLSGLKIHLPPEAQIKDFENRYSVLDDKIELNYKQILTLQKLRDTLLPKLISGEVRVKQ
jgi:type I restriction enzyme S subunit